MAKPLIAFNVKGGKAVDKKLRKMDRRLASRALKAGFRAAMEPVKDEAKRRAPVKTGALRRSIRIAGYSGRGYIGAVVRTGTRKQLKIPANARFYYPAAIEYGVKGVSPRPFLRSALHAKRKVVLNRVVKDVRDAIENV